MAKDRRCVYNVLKNPRREPGPIDGPEGLFTLSKPKIRRCRKPAVCVIHYEDDYWDGDVVVCARHEAESCFEDHPRTRFRRPKKAPTVE